MFLAGMRTGVTQDGSENGEFAMRSREL